MAFRMRRRAVIGATATLLAGRPAMLAKLGVRAVNISLDSLDRAIFARITGHDAGHTCRPQHFIANFLGLRITFDNSAIRKMERVVTRFSGVFVQLLYLGQKCFRVRHLGGDMA